MPLIVKPAFEGSSKGVLSKSVVRDRAELRDTLNQVYEVYRQPVLVEEFIVGDELTVGVLGNQPPQVLGIMRVLPRHASKEPFVYSLEMKREWERLLKYECPAKLSPTDIATVEKATLACWRTLGCRDVSRFDFRLRDGVPYFLEVNPLPGCLPSRAIWSSLPVDGGRTSAAYRADSRRCDRTVRVIIGRVFNANSGYPMPLNVCILYNEPTLPPDDPDWASEAGVLESVEAVEQSLANRGYLSRRLGFQGDVAALWHELAQCASTNSPGRPDVIVNFFEGFGGRGEGESQITGLLDLSGIPYTGSSLECLTLVRDKARTKWMLLGAGIPTAAFEYLLPPRPSAEKEGVSSPITILLAKHGTLFRQAGHEDASLGISLSQRRA